MYVIKISYIMLYVWPSFMHVISSGYIMVWSPKFMYVITSSFIIVCVRPRICMYLRVAILWFVWVSVLCM